MTETDHWEKAEKLIPVSIACHSFSESKIHQATCLRCILRRRISRALADADEQLEDLRADLLVGATEENLRKWMGDAQFEQASELGDRAIKNALRIFDAEKGRRDAESRAQKLVEAGRPMANTMFNLKQQPGREITARECLQMGAMEASWNAALESKDARDE